MIMMFILGGVHTVTLVKRSGRCEEKGREHKGG
jgi:hypothetical protein